MSGWCLGGCWVGVSGWVLDRWLFLHYLAVHLKHKPECLLDDVFAPFWQVRIAVQLYDAELHWQQQRPRPFRWMPALRFMLAGLDAPTLGDRVVAWLWAKLRAASFWCVHP